MAARESTLSPYSRTRWAAISEFGASASAALADSSACTGSSACHAASARARCASGTWRTDSGSAWSSTSKATRLSLILETMDAACAMACSLFVAFSIRLRRLVASPVVWPLDAARASEDATASGSLGDSSTHCRAARKAAGRSCAAMANWKARLASRGSEVSRARPYMSSAAVSNEDRWADNSATSRRYRMSEVSRTAGSSPSRRRIRSSDSSWGGSPSSGGGPAWDHASVGGRSEPSDTAISTANIRFIRYTQGRSARAEAPSGKIAW